MGKRERARAVRESNKWKAQRETHKTERQRIVKYKKYAAKCAYIGDLYM